jgi:hypothetical protein
VEQEDLLRRTIEVLEGLGIRYAIVGSVASAAYGEPRLTQDIDVIVEIAAAHVPRLLEAFPDSDFYLSPEAARAAIMGGGQFNVIHPESGNKIDFLIARRDAWGREQLARRRRLRILAGLEGFAAAPEDIILGKLLYYQEGGSEKHLRDIAGMLRISPQPIDRAYIARWAAELGVGEIWRIIEAREDTRT